MTQVCQKGDSMELHDFYTGQVFDAYTYFGAHVEKNGVTFRTYAPSAQQVTIVGEFNSWQEQPLPQTYHGVFEVYLPHARPGQMYKYCIYGPKGRAEHCDPYGFGMELRPGACSIVRDLGEYTFHDEVWMNHRTRRLDGPLNIYELHFGSWKKDGEDWYTYSALADDLIYYLHQNHYNYVEFLPLSEHPFDGSWGYQNTGFFSPTSRYGTAAQLMELIDRLHQAGIGAILDFVPVHFAVDGYGLKEYDGTTLYEYPHPDVGESEWGSCNFMHSRGEVCSLLQSAANYWLTEYHFDGLRMDAVSRLIYWQGDEARGENGTTLRFLKAMNQGLHALHPTAMLIAEDSTAYRGVTCPVEWNGLGFDYKWDLGWMHDTLSYLQSHPYDRAGQRNKLMFSMHYFYNEQYLLPFSHDEVVHGKKTILDKLYGDYEEKFAQARALYLYMLTHPGKTLNFMGNELAMFREWDERREPDWELLKLPMHDSFHHCMALLNQTYEEHSSLWAWDYRREGFQWLENVSENPCVFGYVRRDDREELTVLLNFSDQAAEYTVDGVEDMKPLLHTGWEHFGGKVRENEPFFPILPPYCGILLGKK